MILDNVLTLKEERFIRQRKLIQEYNLPIISFTMNIPGSQKTEDVIVSLHKRVSTLIKQKLISHNIDFIHEEALVTLLGPECILVVNGLAHKVKKLMIEIEENNLIGRMLDIDVIDEELRVISRCDFGYKRRSCFLCSEEAITCMLNQTHSREELKKKIDEIIKTYQDELRDG